MYELKKIGKVFTSKFVGTGPSSYKKRIYRAAVLQRLRNTALCCKSSITTVGHETLGINNQSAAYTFKILNTEC